MYALQSGFEKKKKNSIDNITFHYHNYDRKYYVQGLKDKYYSESWLQKLRDAIFDNKLSYGFGLNTNMIGDIIKQKHFHLKQGDI